MTGSNTEMVAIKEVALVAAIIAFVVYGVAQLSLGEVRQGVASLMLAAVNGLLLY